MVGVALEGERGGGVVADGLQVSDGLAGSDVELYPSAPRGSLP